jgi:hypothetical protein
MRNRRERTVVRTMSNLAKSDAFFSRAFPCHTETLMYAIITMRGNTMCQIKKECLHLEVCSMCFDLILPLHDCNCRADDLIYQLIYQMGRERSIRTRQ